MNNRFIRHTLHDDPLDKDRLALLKSKGVKKVFIQEDQETLYLAYLDYSMNDLGSATVTTEAKVTVAQSALMEMSENAREALESEEKFVAVKGRVAKITEFMVADTEAVKEFLSNAGISEDVAHHSSTVSMLSVSLASKVGIKDPKLLSDLGIAALYHDIAKGSDFDWTAAPESFSPEQKKLHAEHTKQGALLLAGKDFVNQNIMELVRDHEELAAGAGFPEKKNLDSLSKAQQVLNLVNHFDSYAIRNKLSHADAAKKFFVDKIGAFQLELLNSLRDLLKNGK
ncbi:MAG: HDIG domain-containing protein [Bdellovibrionales bacterium]|nr:HDIG domain-containing protein [Bdellovibrionales bacterium]